MGRGHKILIRDHFLYDIIDIHEILGGEAGELGWEFSPLPPLYMKPCI